MIVLTQSGTDKLQVTTSSGATLDVHATWVDLVSGTSTPGNTNTAIASATTTDIVATPASGQRIVKHLNVRNKDASTSCDVTVIFDKNGTDTELHKVTLAAGDLLEYQEGIGWFVITSTTSTTGVSEWPMLPRSTALTAATAAHFNTAAGTTTLTAPVFPMAMEANVRANMIQLPVQLSITSANTNSNYTWSFGHSLGIYSKTGNSLSLLSSFSNAQTVTYASATASTNASVSWSMQYGSGAALSSSSSTSSNNAGNTSVWTLISNTKLHPFATGSFSMNGGEYFGIWAYSSRSSSTNNASLSQIAIDAAASLTQQRIGAAVGSTTGMYPLLGAVTFTQQNTALPVSIATADVTTATNNASLVNRIPAIQMLSIL